MSQHLIGVVTGSRGEYTYWLQHYNLDAEKYMYLGSRQHLIGRLFKDIEIWGQYWLSPLRKELKGGWNELVAYIEAPAIWWPHGHEE